MSNLRNWALGLAIMALLLLGPVMAVFVVLAAEMLSDLMTTGGVTAVSILAAGVIGWALVRKHRPQPDGSQLGEEA